MKIAVAVDSRFAKVAGHAGRARHWLVYDPEEGPAAARIELEPALVFQVKAPTPWTASIR